MTTASFTPLGIVAVGGVLWIASQSASQDARHALNGILGVLLLSMVVLNWSKIGPIFISGGGGT